MLKFILNRLSEASTCRGLVMFIGGMLGAHMPEAVINEWAQHLIFFILTINGLLGILLPDKVGDNHKDANTNG